MPKESATEIAIRPLGDYALELGLTRYELLELSNHAGDRFGGTVDFLIQILFALLIASFFIAHKLSKSQLGFLLATYTVLFFLNWNWARAHAEEWAAFSAAAGLPPVGTIIIGDVLISDLAILWVLLCAMYFGSIWWVLSCRKNQAKG